MCWLLLGSQEWRDIPRDSRAAGRGDWFSQLSSKCQANPWCEAGLRSSPEVSSWVRVWVCIHGYVARHRHDHDTAAMWLWQHLGMQASASNQHLGKEADSLLGQLSSPIQEEPPLRLFSGGFANSSLQGQAPAPLSKLALSPGRQISRCGAMCSRV